MSGSLECPCCGYVGAESDEDGLFYDDQYIACECVGTWVSVCREDGAWISGDCELEHDH